MNQTEELERLLLAVVLKAEPIRTTASDLYLGGYEPKHRTMRKDIGDYQIVYKEADNEMFEFACIHKKGRIEGFRVAANEDDST